MPDYDELQTRFIGTSLSLGSDLSVSSATETKVPVDAITFDHFKEADTANNKVVSDDGGFYHVSAHSHLANASAATQVTTRVKVNGTVKAVAENEVSAGNDVTSEVSAYVELDPGDEIEIFAEHDSGASETFPASGENYVEAIRQ